MTVSLPLGEGVAILIVLLVGFLPTEMWRTMAVMAGRRLSAESEVFAWVRAVATALLAAVVARLLFTPAGPLLAAPLAVRLAAVAGGVAGFALIRRSIFAGLVVGEAILVLGTLAAGGVH